MHCSAYRKNSEVDDKACETDVRAGATKLHEKSPHQHTLTHTPTHTTLTTYKSTATSITAHLEASSGKHLLNAHCFFLVQSEDQHSVCTRRVALVQQLEQASISVALADYFDMLSYAHIGTQIVIAHLQMGMKWFAKCTH